MRDFSVPCGTPIKSHSSSEILLGLAALSGQVKDIQSALKLLVKEHEKQQKIIEKVLKIGEGNLVITKKK